jgi:LPXTG-motif cell wall-anchored protein
MWKRPLLVVSVLALVLAACETTVERGEMAIGEGVCPRPHDEVSGPSADQDWGSVTPVEDGIEYTVNAGFTATLCSKGGPDHNIITVTGPQSGFLQTPPNNAGNIPGLSHWSVTDVTGSAVATSTTAAIITTTTTTGTTVPENTTTGPENTTTGPENTTTVPEGTTTSEDTSDLTLPGGSTTTLAGASTTVAGDVTTTLEIGDDTLELDPETTTPSETGATGDPGDETTTTAAVGAGSDTTLPYTGVGDMSLGGLAAILLVSGTVLLLLARRRSSED